MSSSCREKQSQLLVALAFNASYLRSYYMEDHSSRSFQVNSSENPISKNSQSKMDWRCGLSSRVPALKVQNPTLKSQSHQKQKKKKKKERKQGSVSVSYIFFN
jgi:hypothetical protein